MVNRIFADGELEAGCLAVVRCMAEKPAGALCAANALMRRSYPDIAGAIGEDRPDFASEPLQRDVRRRVIARRHPLVDA